MSMEKDPLRDVYESLKNSGENIYTVDTEDTLCHFYIMINNNTMRIPCKRSVAHNYIREWIGAKKCIVGEDIELAKQARDYLDHGIYYFTDPSGNPMLAIAISNIGAMQINEVEEGLSLAERQVRALEKYNRRQERGEEWRDDI